MMTFRKISNFQWPLKKILTSNFRNFFISIDIRLLKLVLNFQTLIGKISVFITQKLQSM